VTQSFRKVLQRLQAGDLLIRSSALAYHTLLGIVPLVGLVFWYLKKIGVADHWIGLTRTFILERLNVTSSEMFLKYFNGLTEKVEGESWGWVGLILLLYSSWSLLGKFSGSLDAVVSGENPTLKTLEAFTKVWSRRLVSMVCLPLALMVSLVLSHWIREDSWAHRLFEVPHLGAFIALPIAWMSIIVAVFFIYYFIPSKKIPAKRALMVALVIGPLLEILRASLGIYAHYAVSMHKIYGILSVVPLFMLWIQLSWALLLAGAIWLRPKRVS